MKSSEKEFIAESAEILDEAGELLLEIQDTLEKGVNPDTINALFRAMHTLKGTSGLFGYQGVTDISHNLESLLDDVRLGKVEVEDDVLSFLFKYIDILRSLTGDLQQEGGQTDVSGYLREIEAFRNSLRGGGEYKGLEGVIDESILKVLSEYEEHRLKANLKEGKNIYMVKTVFPISEFDKSLVEMTKTIKSLGELVSTMPMPQDSPDKIGFNLMVGSTVDLQQIKDAAGFDVDTIVEAKAAPEAPGKERETLKTAAASTVRVDIDKLDRVLNTIGDLTLAKDALRRVWGEMVEVYGHSSLVIDLYRLSQTFHRRVAELQEEVLEIRMVPIGQIFSRLAQVIRRYSREVGKQINLSVFGEDTEIDKALAEEIIDPLVHTVRNAIDHGIETADERRAAGKKETGAVTLRAFQRGNNVVVEVQDDGRGIDTGRIRQKAIDKGIIGGNEGIKEKELLELIFTPGFSTKEEVSEVSGRGVGLDIVRDNLSSLGGVVEVQTGKGSGCTFTFTLPITLAIIKALIVRVGTERFAVSLSSVFETLSVEQGMFQTIENRKVYNLRGEMLPMTGLSEVFGIPGDSGGEAFAVVLGSGEKRKGILVDELLGQYEVVIKSLGGYFEGLRGFAGAAEIGKHEVILVLDAESLLGESTRKGPVHV